MPINWRFTKILVDFSSNLFNTFSGSNTFAFDYSFEVFTNWNELHEWCGGIDSNKYTFNGVGICRAVTFFS